MNRKIIWVAIFLIILSSVLADRYDLTFDTDDIKENGANMNGIYNVSIDLYYVFTGGSSVFNENYSNYNITNGVIHVIMHNTSALNWSQNVYGSLSINGTALASRFNLTSAGHANNMDWGDIDNIPADISDGDDGNSTEEVINTINSSALTFIFNSLWLNDWSNVSITESQISDLVHTTDTSNTSADMRNAINDSDVRLNSIESLSWSNVSITESQISDLVHTTDTSNTSADMRNAVNGTDANFTQIVLGDNEQIIFGNGADTKMYWNGSHFRIEG